MKSKYISLFFLIITFNLLAINYLYEFDQGTVKGGFIERLLIKSLIFIYLLYGLFKFGIKQDLVKKNLLILLFYMLSFLILLIRIPNYPIQDFQLVNLILVSPILFGLNVNKFIEEKILYNVLLFSILFWTITDSFLLINNLNIWKNSAFIGGVGNPSNYGLLLISFYLLFVVRTQGTNFLLTILLAYNLFLTQSLMPILMFFFILFIRLKNIIKLVIFTLSTFLLIKKDIVLEILPDTHWKFKLVSLVDFFSDFSLVGLSQSIIVRVNFFSDTNKLFNSVTNFLFGNINELNYNFGDSQFVTLITSFGVPLFLIFLLFQIKLLVKSYNTDFFLFFLVCFLFMITNRILDYWPFPFIYFYAINKMNSDLHENSYS